MMLAKLCCDRSEGFESGLTAWELDVGEWERASGTALKHSDDDCGTEVYWGQSAVGYMRQQCRFSNSFVAMV